MVTTTSPRFTSRARKRAAHKVIDVCSWAQVADAPSTVRTNCRFGSVFAIRFTMAGNVSCDTQIRSLSSLRTPTVDGGVCSTRSR